LPKRIRTKFRRWLTVHGACKAGKVFAGDRTAFETVTDPTLSIEYMLWYLARLGMPLDMTHLDGFSDRVQFSDLSLHARWRRVTKILRASPHLANEHNVVFLLWTPVSDHKPIALDRRAYVPIPRSTLSGWGEAVSVLSPDGIYSSRWMKDRA
jgi:hypothetical protein